MADCSNCCRRRSTRRAPPRWPSCAGRPMAYSPHGNLRNGAHGKRYDPVHARHPCKFVLGGPRGCPIPRSSGLRGIRQRRLAPSDPGRTTACCFWHTPRGRREPMRTRLVAERRVLTAILVAVAAPAASAADKVTMAVPGVPPVFSGLVAYVAKEEGFFKKHGVEVEVRPFDSGAAAAQAVVSGNIDLSLSPTPVIVRMVSNAGVDLVGIYGMANPDWLLAST